MNKHKFYLIVLTCISLVTREANIFHMIIDILHFGGIIYSYTVFLFTAVLPLKNYF